MTPTNHMTTVQGPGSLPVRAFCYVLNYPLIESFDCCPVESCLVESQYFQFFFDVSRSKTSLVSNSKSLICLQ